MTEYRDRRAGLVLFGSLLIAAGACCALMAAVLLAAREELGNTIEALGALAHPNQTEMAGGGGEHVTLFESPAVVDNF